MRRLLARLFRRDPGPEVPEFVRQKSPKPHLRLSAECGNPKCCRPHGGET